MMTMFRFGLQFYLCIFIARMKRNTLQHHKEFTLMFEKKLY
jgi:hypothetical protein